MSLALSVGIHAGVVLLLIWGAPKIVPRIEFFSGGGGAAEIHDPGRASVRPAQAATPIFSGIIEPRERMRLSSQAHDMPEPDARLIDVRLIEALALGAADGVIVAGSDIPAAPILPRRQQGTDGGDGGGDSAHPPVGAGVGGLASNESIEGTGQGGEGTGRGAAAQGAVTDGPMAPVARAGNVAPAHPDGISEGTVIVRFTINADGSVEDVSVRQSSGHDVLDRAARNAVRRWRFEPPARAMVVDKVFEFKR